LSNPLFEKNDACLAKFVTLAYLQGAHGKSGPFYMLSCSQGAYLANKSNILTNYQMINLPKSIEIKAQQIPLSNFLYPTL
jgi:hypothetical protein